MVKHGSTEITNTHRKRETQREDKKQKQWGGGGGVQTELTETAARRKFRAKRKTKQPFMDESGGRRLKNKKQIKVVTETVPESKENSWTKSCFD